MASVHCERNLALAHMAVGREHLPLQFVRSRFQTGRTGLQSIGSLLASERERRRCPVRLNQAHARTPAIYAHIESQVDVEVRAVDRGPQIRRRIHQDGVCPAHLCHTAYEKQQK